jgi:hypothetical protein
MLLLYTAAAAAVQSARGPRISGWYEDVSVYTLIYNILAYNKVVNLHDYVEYGLGKVTDSRAWCCILLYLTFVGMPFANARRPPRCQSGGTTLQCSCRSSLAWVRPPLGRLRS